MREKNYCSQTKLLNKYSRAIFKDRGKHYAIERHNRVLTNTLFRVILGPRIIPIILGQYLNSIKYWLLATAKKIRYKNKWSLKAELNRSIIWKPYIDCTHILYSGTRIVRFYFKIGFSANFFYDQWSHWSLQTHTHTDTCTLRDFQRGEEEKTLRISHLWKFTESRVVTRRKSTIDWSRILLTTIARSFRRPTNVCVGARMILLWLRDVYSI